MEILVIGDEPKVGYAGKEGLRAEGYYVTLASTGEEGFFLALSHVFDLIVLEVMLPVRDPWWNGPARPTAAELDSTACPVPPATSNCISPVATAIAGI